MFTVRMCEKCVFKRKAIPIKVNFLLWEKLHFEFNKFDFLKNFNKNRLWGGRARKEPTLQLRETNTTAERICLRYNLYLVSQPRMSGKSYGGVASLKVPITHWNINRPKKAFKKQHDHRIDQGRYT